MSGCILTVQARALVKKINKLRSGLEIPPLEEPYMADSDTLFPCRVHDNSTGTTEAGTERDIVWWLRGMKASLKVSREKVKQTEESFESGGGSNG